MFGAPGPPKSSTAHWKNKDFASLHFSTPDPKNRLSGPVWDPQILQNRSRNASRGAQDAPRWRPNRPLDPQDGRPGEPRALQTAFQTVQEPILDVPGPSKPRFWPPGTHFAPIWRSQASFWTPRDQFSSPQAPISQPRLPFAPVLHASKSFQAFPSLQGYKPPSLQG